MRHGIVRASLAKLSNSFPLLGLNVSTAQAYSVTQKQKDSALFEVECRVTKIHDF